MDDADDRTVEVEPADKQVPDEQKVIVVTEPQETRYTLDQVRQERDMAASEVESARQRLADAEAKVAEAEGALGL